ncbi:hypothetical protein A3A67_03350 [Candidatus Peribacteria bacterium RIFCSPLOWO2_01_FULL_51_18]|nr:MAG: hypothetical protein A3A67_03350 [Candidatus Peribacteria bacterium RIFCSPLOWO2_01_FULL_51_18]OGJ68309.1 MAG: hypothetical protein A3J34_04075 [Candidatus Peribacteria bacterium RIFCSPLOWO2_02_FULL_51_10]
MLPITIDCQNLAKTFLREKIPLRLLQDRILKRKLHGDMVRIDALKNVSLQARRGEWVGVYGPNGSGKSTMLKIIAGIMKSDRGSVQVSGRLSCFFELGVGFHTERRADENIYLHGLIQGMSRREILKLTDRIIDKAGVRSHFELPLKCYSTGMRLRLAFAAASEINADVFLFDEILAVGDADFKAGCWRHLFEMKKAGKTGLLVSHDMAELDRICDRVIMLEKGVVLNHGQPKTFA